MKKKKKCSGFHPLVMASVMKAVAIYFGVLGIRLQMMSYRVLVWEALATYLVAVCLFIWGKQIHSCMENK